MRKRRGLVGLSLEGLESRRLLAGDVTIIDNSFGGTLEIIGDSADNFLVANQGGAADTLTFTGVPTAGGPTTINGSTNPFTIDLVNFDGEIRIINADLGDGDDLFFFENATVLADINANMGGGDDDLEFSNTQVAGTVVATNAEDVTMDTFFVIDDVSVTGDQLGVIDIFDARFDNSSVTIASTSGNNGTSENINIVNSDIEDNLTITMDRAGRAWVTEGSVGGNLIVNTNRGGSHDINVERNNVGGALSITTRGGGDQIHLGSQTITGGASIVSGGGADSITLDSVTVDRGDLFVNAGGGNDTFYSENGVWQTTDIRLGNGADNLTIFDAVLENDAAIRGAGGGDTMLVSGVNVAGTLDVFGNGGNDALDVTFGTFNGGLNVNLGNGNDTLRAGSNTLFAASDWNGAGGTDSYTELSPNVVNGTLNIRNFESTSLNDRETDEAIVEMFAVDPQFAV